MEISGISGCEVISHISQLNIFVIQVITLSFFK